jgi:hypothetical protein
MMNEATGDRQSQSNQTALIEFAERQIPRLRLWWLVLWNCHIWLLGLSFATAIAVPFGLAALLYAGDKATQTQLNVALLVLSGTSLVLQAADIAGRLGPRAYRLRRIHHRLMLAATRFRAGIINVEQLNVELGALVEDHIEEEMP